MYRNDWVQIFQPLGPHFGGSTTRHLMPSRVTCNRFYNFSVISWVLEDAELIFITSLQITKPRTSILGFPFKQ